MKNFNLTILLVFSIFLSSCSAIPYGNEIGRTIGGQSKSFQADYELVLLDNDKDISYQRVKQYLESIDFNYEGKVANIEKFSKNYSEIKNRVAGEYKTTTISITKNETNLILNINNYGNYGWGTKEKTNNFFNEIKNNYLKK
jgi:hypothetical protein